MSDEPTSRVSSEPLPERPSPRSILAELAPSEGVPSAFASVRDGIDVLLRDRGLRRTSPEMTAESLLRGARASAALEGSTSDLEQVRAGAGDEVARDAVRLSAQLLGIGPLLARTPLQALARLHAVASAGRLPDHLIGRPRDADAAACLRAVADLLTAPTDAPALLVGAVAHAELMSTAPFASHNGLVARAVERLVLVSRGVDEKSLIVPEAGHLAHRAAYESNLRGYARGGPAGRHGWALYAAEAYARAAEESPVRPG